MMIRSNSRRAFMREGIAYLAGLQAGHVLAADDSAKPLCRVGMVTDLHYGDKEPAQNRFYRDALIKLDEAVELFNQEKPAFVVELGDIVDQAESVEVESAWLDTIEEHYAKLQMPRHYVLGNHCVTTLTKTEFAVRTKASQNSYYAFDESGIRFIVLDACFREDEKSYERKNFHWQNTAIPAIELEWLKAELARASGPVIVFAHQRLDIAPKHQVLNADAVRAVLEKSGKVLAVFQGHSHKNDYQQISNVHYCTQAAMIEGSGLENSSYSLLEVMPDFSLRLKGFRRQLNRNLSVSV